MLMAYKNSHTVQLNTDFVSSANATLLISKKAKKRRQLVFVGAKTSCWLGWRLATDFESNVFFTYTIRNNRVRRHIARDNIFYTHLFFDYLSVAVLYHRPHPVQIALLWKSLNIRSDFHWTTNNSRNTYYDITSIQNINLRHWIGLNVNKYTQIVKKAINKLIDLRVKT